MNDLAMKEIMRSKEEKRIITGKIIGIEDEYYKIAGKNIPCAILWYENIKILIPCTHIGINKINKAIMRGMLGAEIDYIVMEIDTVANIAIASRKDAMELRAKLELTKLKSNDVVKVRIVSVGIKHIIVELYGKEVIINADELQHTYILNCKEEYLVGEYLKARVKEIDIQNSIFKLSAKEFVENPYKNIRKYIIDEGEYTRKVIGFPKKNSGIIVQLDVINVTCLVRVPARFNSYPHYFDKVLIRVNEIKEEKKWIVGYLVRVI